MDATLWWQTLWLVDEVEQYIELPGPCLVRGEQTAPLEEDRGVYWLYFQKDGEPHKPHTVNLGEDVLVAPVNHDGNFEDDAEDFDPIEDASALDIEGADDIAATIPPSPAILERIVPAQPTFEEQRLHVLGGHAKHVPWCSSCV